MDDKAMFSEGQTIGPCKTVRCISLSDGRRSIDGKVKGRCHAGRCAAEWLMAP